MYMAHAHVVNTCVAYQNKCTCTCAYVAVPELMILNQYTHKYYKATLFCASFIYANYVSQSGGRMNLYSIKFKHYEMVEMQK
jgi:hypothetical protein